MLLETIIYTSEPKVWWEIWLSPFVTIVGLGVTWYLTTKTIKKEVEHKKANIALDELATVPFELLILFNGISSEGATNEITDKFIKLVSKIFTYGSEDAIKITANMQSYIYAANKEEVEDKSEKITRSYFIMAYYIILTCQIKYDLTEIEINPDYWYKIKLTDYEEMQPGLKDVTNKIVKDLNLGSVLNKS